MVEKFEVRAMGTESDRGIILHVFGGRLVIVSGAYLGRFVVFRRVFGGLFGNHFESLFRSGIWSYWVLFIGTMNTIKG